MAQAERVPQEDFNVVLTLSKDEAQVLRSILHSGVGLTRKVQKINEALSKVVGVHPQVHMRGKTIVEDAADSRGAEYDYGRNFLKF